MIKYNVLAVFLFFLNIFSLYGQTKNVTVNVDWSGMKNYTFQSTSFNYFQPLSGAWKIEESIPYANKVFNTNSSQATFQITNFQTAELSLEEVKCLLKEVPQDFIFNTKVISSRKKNKLLVSVNAVRKNIQTGRFEKLVSYKGVMSTPPSPLFLLKNYALSSVLKSGSGDWYKIGLVKDGVYKLDYTFLKNLGIDIDNVSPNAINIYGNGAGMLPESNAAFRFDDLAKNSIYIEGEDDGSFDANDYVLFYAKGPHTWEQNGNSFVHSVHQYCDTSYYFINVNNSGGTPKRLSNISLSSLTPTHNITSFNDFAYVEDEKYNLGKSGREWFGDIYDVQTSYNYGFNFPNLISQDSVLIRTNTLISATSVAPYFTVGIGNNVQQLPNMLSPSGNGQYNPYARQKINTHFLKANSSEFSVNINFNKAGAPSAVGWLDFMEVNVMRSLSMASNQMEFRSLESVGTGNVTNFTISNAGNIEMLWEVTDPRNAGIVNYDLVGNQASFSVNTDSLRTFIAMDNSNFLTPDFYGKIEHQDLHALSYADMIIVTAPEFITASNELSAFHQSEGLSVHVVTTNQIFNEFSSGMRDATAIKSFLRMFYKRAGSNPNLIPKYCLLMGDGSYDNRNILVHNKNFIPTYESVETLSKTASYTTDDYFAILSDNGAMNNSDLLDVAIGRLPVKTLKEANDMVAKIKYYGTVNNTTSTVGHCANNTSSGVLSDWRNIAIQISDDGDNNHYFNDIETMYNKARLLHPEMNLSKIHADAYVETSTAGGERNYEAEKAFKQQVENGALLVNYIGHGGETGLGHERYLTVPTVLGWTNLARMPIFMTATCEFSRFDDHDRTSAGEYVVLNPNGGGIGLFTTTRLVYSTSNAALNSYFYDTVFDKVNNEAPRLGDIYMGTKNKYGSISGDVNYRKFALLGDPAVKLALPQYHIVTDSINGKSLNMTLDTITALSKVVIKGHVENHLGQKLENFNGVITTKIYDKVANLTTLGNSPDSSPANFSLWKNLVYRGKASVKNGAFVFSFIVPKDISFQYGNGRISYYAENGETDANGYTEQPIIGGINEHAADDNEPPVISLYMNNDKFVSGGVTDENPSLFAKVFDENGINTVGNGVGHNIEAILDKNTTNAIILNDFYETDLDTYKSGKITYPFENLEEGAHTLSLKVWDVYNNSQTEDIEFVVASNEELALDHILNYPNPFTTKTEFSFEHNQVCDYLDVQIQIYTISGKVVKTINQRAHTSGYRVDGIQWNGTDDYGDNIGKGVYVYKVKVVNEKGDKVEKFEKLVVLK
ncbi:MAG: type IX secretion system sortase PorU [Flavobacteriales bacterium]|jgi:hypothetical protein|nr:type IX secretion system sortase PorU [Flavobacteriales bacterium]